MKKLIYYKKAAAFTLVELLLAVFVLEIGLLGIAAFYASSTNISKRARMETTASNLAAGLLDEELALSYGSLASVSKQKYSTDPNNPFYNWYKQVDIICIDINLAQIACDSNAHMKKIVVTVYWPDQSTEKSFQTASIKAEH